MIYHVYAIKSQDRNIIYVGISNNLERRLAEHNLGRNRSTKAYRPFFLFYSETFLNRRDARAREKYLKSGIGKEKLKQILAGVA